MKSVGRRGHDEEAAGGRQVEGLGVGRQGRVMMVQEGRLLLVIWLLLLLLFFLGRSSVGGGSASAAS